MDGFDAGTVRSPNHPLWMETETEAFRNGPYLQAILFRLLTYTSFIVFMLFGFWWHVLAMFFLGAALMKLRIFDPDRLGWHRWFVFLGTCVGLPIVVLETVLPTITDAAWAHVAMGPMGMLGGPLMSLGYLGAVTLLVASGRWRGITDALAAAGRMALTLYLCESVIATFIMYHWGLGQFGLIARPARMLLVLGVYLGLVLAANLWLRAFRMGPMEWVWRTATYLRLPRLAP